MNNSCKKTTCLGLNSNSWAPTIGAVQLFELAATVELNDSTLGEDTLIRSLPNIEERFKDCRNSPSTSTKTLKTTIVCVLVCYDILFTLLHSAIKLYTMTHKKEMSHPNLALQILNFSTFLVQAS